MKAEGLAIFYEDFSAQQAGCRDGSMGSSPALPSILRGEHWNGSEEKATRIIAGFLTFSVLQLEKGKHGKTKVKRCGIEPPKA